MSISPDAWKGARLDRIGTSPLRCRARFGLCVYDCALPLLGAAGPWWPAKPKGLCGRQSGEENQAEWPRTSLAPAFGAVPVGNRDQAVNVRRAKLRKQPLTKATGDHERLTGNP